MNTSLLYIIFCIWCAWLTSCSLGATISRKPYAFEAGQTSFASNALYWNAKIEAQFDKPVLSFYDLHRPLTAKSLNGSQSIVYAGTNSTFAHFEDGTITFYWTDRRVRLHAVGNSVPSFAITSSTLSCGTAVYYSRRLLSYMGSSTTVINMIVQAFSIAEGVYARDVESLVAHIDDIRLFDYALGGLTTIDSVHDYFSDRINNDGCASVLFDVPVYGYTVGIAYLDGGCTATGTAVVTYSDMATCAVILAHELGHLFSAEHVTTPTVMNADISVDGFVFEFSTTSDNTIDTWSESATCLVYYNTTTPYVPEIAPGDDHIAVIVATVCGSVVLLILLIFVLKCMMVKRKSYQ